MDNATLTDIRNLVKAARIAKHCEDHWYDDYFNASVQGVAAGKYTEDERHAAAMRHKANHDKMLEARRITGLLAEKLKGV